jgi:hypothetical protein
MPYLVTDEAQALVLSWLPIVKVFIFPHTMVVNSNDLFQFKVQQTDYFF